MKKLVLAGSLIFSAALAGLNNLINHRSVDWIGSPQVLEKPTGWPATSIGMGVSAGLKVAWKGFLSHSLLILGGIAITMLLMALIHRFRQAPISPMVRTVFRIGMAALFLTAAYPKFLDPSGFASLVAQYQFLPRFLVNGFTLWLAAFEITVGLGILLTPWEKEFSALVALLLVMFIVALAQALGRDLGIACGCFDIEGAADVGETWFSLIRDLVLLVPMAWMVRSSGYRFLWQVQNR